MLSRPEAIDLVKRIRAHDEDAGELLARFCAGVPRPDAEELFWDSMLSDDHLAAIALGYESIVVEGMTIPLWRNDDGARWIWFLDPRRTALHWIGAFRAVIQSGDKYASQGFWVSPSPPLDELPEARARWLEWTGRELGDDVYVLEPAWGRRGDGLRRGHDEPLIAPRSFLLALLDAIDRERLGLRGGSFGRSA